MPAVLAQLTWPPQSWEWEALGQMIISALIGGLVGIEREYHGRSAGFRTHILVCLGCCTVMLVSVHFARMFAELGAESAIRVDPARLAYGVVTGIGFLGAGVIMKTGVTVRGLTTAASLWCVAALGLGVGVRLYLLAAFGTLLMIFVLLTLQHLGSSIRAHTYVTVRITAPHATDPAAIQRELESLGAVIMAVALDHRRREGTLTITHRLRFTGRHNLLELDAKLRKNTELQRVEIR